MLCVVKKTSINKLQTGTGTLSVGYPTYIGGLSRSGAVAFKCVMTLVPFDVDSKLHNVMFYPVEDKTIK